MDTKQQLYDSLNEHGFLFQEKCIEIFKNNEADTGWNLITNEYPVSVGNKESRIDIILKDKYSDGIDIYAIVECKRVYVGEINWLFGKPFIPDYYTPLLTRLTGQYNPHTGFQRNSYEQIKYSFANLGTYLINNWWLEAKNGKGNTKPLEDAFTQACLGASGLSSEHSRQLNKNHQNYLAMYIPLVITNAQLFYSEYDLHDVAVATGKIDITKINFGTNGQTPEKIPWLMIDYPVSETIAPEKMWMDVQGISPAELEDYHRKSIYVVNSEHIINFFSKLH